MPKQPPLQPYEALRIIQFLIGSFIVLSGLYLLAPWNLIAPDSIWAAAASNFPAYVGIMGGSFLFIGTLEVFASVKGYHTKWSRVSQWLSVAVFIFLIITRLMQVGILPILWLYPLALLGISLVLSLAIRVR